MLDLLRSGREILAQFSTMQVFGIPVDWFFHLVGATVIFFFATRFISLKKSLWLTIGLLVGKEVFDVFAKTRLEYIRPPTVDLALDMTAGLAGIGAGYLLAKRYPRLLSNRRTS